MRGNQWIIFITLKRWYNTMYFMHSVVMAGGQCYMKWCAERKEPKGGLLKWFDCFPLWSSPDGTFLHRSLTPRASARGSGVGPLWHRCSRVIALVLGFQLQPFGLFLEKLGRTTIILPRKWDSGYLHLWRHLFVYLLVGFIPSVNIYCLPPTRQAPC